MPNTPSHNLDLTAYLIVRNEEIHLPRCLESFQGIWKNLLVVDTGSTDKTKQIARDFGAEILDFEWIDDFSAARNFALENIKSEWLIWFDADDIIHPDDKLQLIEEFDKSIPKFDLTLLSYIYFGTRENRQLVHYFPRIWKTSQNYRYHRPIHEALDCYQRPNVTRQYLDIPYIHNKQISHINSIERNLEMLNKHLQSHPDDEDSIFYLGLEYKDLNNLEKSNYYFQKFIDIKPKFKPRLYEANWRIGINYLKLGNAPKAKEYLDKALTIMDIYIEPYLLLAEIEMNLYSPKRAIELLKKARTLTPPKTEIEVETKYYTGYADRLLDLAYRKLL